MRDFKKLYDCLLETEELYILFPNLTGVWGKDQKKFIKAQTDLEQDAKAYIVDEEN